MDEPLTLSLPFPSLISHLASVDIKQHVYFQLQRRMEMGEDAAFVVLLSFP